MLVNFHKKNEYEFLSKDINRVVCHAKVVPSISGKPVVSANIGDLRESWAKALERDLHVETEERLAGFRQGLAKRGWVEGRNIHIDYRFAAGRGSPRLP